MGRSSYVFLRFFGVFWFRFLFSNPLIMACGENWLEIFWISPTGLMEHPPGKGGLDVVTTGG
jgi:hypothetical protein